MIQTKDYLRISRLFREGESGNMMLRKRRIPKGLRLRTYDADQGRYHVDMMASSFPIVALIEKGEPADEIWMSDAPFEQECLKNVVEHARGDVLICGLGIGLLPMLLKERNEQTVWPTSWAVEGIDIVENNPDVIKLVMSQLEPTFKAWEDIKYFGILQDDAFDMFRDSDQRYDFIYVDIWKGVLSPLQEAENTLQAASRLLKPGGEVRIWMQELYDRIKERLPKEPMMLTNAAGIHEPCLICEKTLRNDFAGLCMDCADLLGVSEIYMKRKEETNGN